MVAFAGEQEARIKAKARRMPKYFLIRFPSYGDTAV
jgi:hypothetical protein